MRTSKALRTKITHLLTEIDTPLPDLETTLTYLQARSCSLHYDNERILDIWSPGHRLTIGVRRSIRKHLDELLELMEAGDVRCCPTTLHKRHWRRGTCQMCRRLQSSVNPSHPDVMRVG